MADDDRVAVVDDSKIVTDFFLKTCLKQPNASDVIAALLCGDLMAVKSNTRIPLKTGSTAELYMKPILSCVGDLDVMFHHNTMLAIPANYPPPTQLPAEFYSRVKVCEIIDSEFPGYVFLRFRYLLSKCNDDCTYSAVRVDRQVYLSYNYNSTPSNRINFHGPAETYNASGIVPAVDLVLSLRCLSWPLQAANWPARHRNWPDSATVDRVVSNGCDVVQVGHHMYRLHEIPGKRQWRLSFSRAEVVLFNSCVPVQQIVYHMLRVFVKTEQLSPITDNRGTKILSNYHIKTLMLWACERQSRSLWSDDINVVRICTKLLCTLCVWLTDVQFPHYFVNNCNLIETALNCEITTKRLTSITESWLSTWFVNNYIQKCSMHCPGSVSRLMDDVSTSIKLKNAVSAIIDWRLNTAQKDLWDVFYLTMWYVPGGLSRLSTCMTVGSCACLMKELTKIDSRLSIFITAFTFLHASYKIPIYGLNDDLLDILTTAVGHFVDPVRYVNRRNMLSLYQAAMLMKVGANNSSCSNAQLIVFELSKAYLHRALRCSNFDKDSIYCLANVYLAVLYYSTGNYQKAVDYCTLVMMSQDHKQCYSHTVQGELLPKVDDNVNNVLGLAGFYHYVRTTVLGQQWHNILVFTTDAFARYLNICSLSVTKSCHFTQLSIGGEIVQYSKYIIDKEQPFLADLLLCKSLSVLYSQNCRHNPATEKYRNSTTNTMELNTSELVELLQQSAVEHMTTFRHLTARQFSSQITIVTTDFKALYAYKRGNYHQCFQMSVKNVRMLQNSAMSVAFSLMPEFLQFLDDDIVSLTAVTLMTNSKCRIYMYYASITQLTLSLYLMTQCQLKLLHSPSRLGGTLDYIKILQRKPDLTYRVFDRLTLKLTERKIMTYLTAVCNIVSSL